MNLQPINPYQIIEALKAEVERLKKENEELKKKEVVTDGKSDTVG